MQHAITIGTRASPLALKQAEEVKARLLAVHDDLSPDDLIIKPIKTTGDRILDRHLMAAGGKGLFTKEIEAALMAGDIDFAVHSGKDVPTSLPDGLALTTFLPREDPRDVLISRAGCTFDALPRGAVVGTASLRRGAMARRLRPDLKVVTFRGSVQTRLDKLKKGEADATFLALSGLKRLDMAHVASEILPVDRFVPAPAQGALALEVRAGEEALNARLAPLHDGETALQASAERAFLAALDGSCRTPIAAHAWRDGDRFTLVGALLSIDGNCAFEDRRSIDLGPDPIAEARALGHEMGTAIRARAGEDFFRKLFDEVEAQFA
ncbi:hydroxymethylbilane synthase [Yunchengibacter salinarum]|uniref:hydroxymethylbilane synthase n=1 Tax=Yunchengibacter salinarum TaxID=3133399 RepID=UPI0035B615BE